MRPRGEEVNESKKKIGDLLENPKVNVYVCQKCKGGIMTTESVKLVTPFMIGCKRHGCDGMMTSRFYNIPPHIRAQAKPSYEWVLKDPMKEIGELVPICTCSTAKDRSPR